jgi:hypothetical protein
MAFSTRRTNEEYDLQKEAKLSSGESSRHLIELGRFHSHGRLFRILISAF